MIDRYSIAVRHDNQMKAVPWAAELRDHDIRAEHSWAMRFLGSSVESAILGLLAMAKQGFEWSEEVLASLQANAVVEIERITAPSDTALGFYTDRMDDENDFDDRRGEGKPDPASLKRCEKCDVGSHYPNGDKTQIADRPDRLGVIKQFCHTCALEEQLTRLNAQRRMLAVNMPEPKAPRSFTEWLTPGDLLRGHGIGAKLDGELPTPTPAQLNEFIFEYSRSY